MRSARKPSSDTAADARRRRATLDRKINRLFPGVVVRKDLVKAVKGNAIVPSYVLEYLLGQYAASDDEATIQAGIDTVRKILADHYVHRNQSELVKSTIRERGRHRIIDKVTVTLNEKADVYEAEFANLGIKGVLVEPADDQGTPEAARRRRLVHLRHRVLPQRGRTGRAVDPRLDQADPAVELRLRAATSPRGASSPPTSGSTCSCSPSGSTPSCSAGGPSSSSSCG